MGVSLGGHSVWQLVLHEPRISTAVVVIGCPDYTNLMTDRAQLSKLETWTQSSPPGSTFIGSSDFPRGLVAAIESYDPAGVLLGHVANRTDDVYERQPNEEDKRRLLPLIGKLHGKRILNLSGATDKLVPYAQSKPFLEWFKNSLKPAGWLAEEEIVLKDLVFEGVGHDMSPAMLNEAVHFIAESLELWVNAASTPAAKI